MWSAPDGEPSAMTGELSTPTRSSDAIGAVRGARLSACIMDVDGVLLASPHEQAWREALVGFADPDRFTSAMYQAEVAGKPRLDGALAALVALKVADAMHQAPVFAERKQSRLEAIVLAEGVSAFPDALRFVEAILHLGLKLAAASSSKNANQMMRSISLVSGQPLLDAFSANVCGRDLRHGKPDPELFLLAAAELGQPPGACLVVEDAPSGVAAARAGGMSSLGVARHGDEAGLESAGANLVVASLDDVSLLDLAEGRLRRRPA
jgi:beta-phosphoglucomutase